MPKPWPTSSTERFRPMTRPELQPIHSKAKQKILNSCNNRIPGLTEPRTYCNNESSTINTYQETTIKSQRHNNQSHTKMQLKQNIGAAHESKQQQAVTITSLGETNARDILKKILKSQYQSTQRDNLFQKNAANQPTQKAQDQRKAIVSRN